MYVRPNPTATTVCDSNAYQLDSFGRNFQGEINLFERAPPRSPQNIARQPPGSRENAIIQRVDVDILYYKCIVCIQARKLPPRRVNRVRM